MLVMETYNYVRLGQKLPNTEKEQSMHWIIKKLKRFLYQQRRKGRKTIVNVKRFRPF
jgi:hypothetical protein